jgi:hypothetical protein
MAMAMVVLVNGQDTRLDGGGSDLLLILSDMQAFGGDNLLTHIYHDSLVYR